MDYGKGGSHAHWHCSTPHGCNYRCTSCAVHVTLNCPNIKQPEETVTSEQCANECFDFGPGFCTGYSWSPSGHAPDYSPGACVWYNYLGSDSAGEWTEVCTPCAVGFKLNIVKAQPPSQCLGN